MISTKDIYTYSVWDDPNSRLTSEYGFVTYRIWCEKERERLAARGKTVEIRTASDGQIALKETGVDEDD